MGIFSRLMANKEDVEKREEVSLDTYLQGGGGKINALEDAGALLESTISKEEKITKLLKAKEGVQEQIDELLKGREELIKAKSVCQSIAKKEFKNSPKEFDEYIECHDFKELPEKYKILKVLREMAPEVFEVIDYPITEVAIAVKELHTNWLELEGESIALKEEGDILRADINKFAVTINEMKNKYKLSPDWEGKKPALMSYQSQLKERREKYLGKEKRVEAKINILYEDYAEVYEVFVQCSSYFIKVLEEKANEFVNDSQRVDKLQELLRAKQRIEIEINEI